MSKKDKIILVIIALIILVPIAINELNQYNLRTFKKEAFKISEALKNTSSELKEIDINKKIKVKDKLYKTKGVGKAFVNKDNVTVILSYRGYCAVKLNITQDVALSKSTCPNIDLIKGTVIPIVKKDGLVKENKNYYYQGKVDNYIEFSNLLWRILSIEDNKMKIVKVDPIKGIAKDQAIGYLNKDFYNSLDKSLIEKSTFDISNIVINKEINKKDDKTITENIGILSLSDYLNTLTEECKIKNSNLICSESYMTKNMWLSNYYDNKGYYVYNDGNIYVDNINELKDIYPVLTLNKNVQIISGDGTRISPYQIK